MTLYTHHLFGYQRRKTREVKVGDVGVGGANPIRVQSMTISDTMDTEAVVKEAKGLVEVGCEIVRITAPTIHHAENLKNIRNRLRQDGIQVPLVADIHFTPQAAMIAADYVEKVRINPGNYADRKLFAVKEYTDAEYKSELQRMADKFIPLVKKCKERGIAMRIGTNHGSLSDRIMNRYGDTPLGMVESALEFARLCESEGYQDLIFSMKASSPFVMIAAYRLLAQRMNELGMDYPFHLGVTEAGEGEDGRIKSAVGIGALLEDGIGDTIRVSLTEDSVHEIPVAQQLVKKFNKLSRPLTKTEKTKNPEISWDTIERHRRESLEVISQDFKLGANHAYGVFSTYSLQNGEAETYTKLKNYVAQAKKDAPFPDIIFLSDISDLKNTLGLKQELIALRPSLKVGIQTKTIKDAEAALEFYDAASCVIANNTKPETLQKITQQVKSTHKLLVLRFASTEEILRYLDKFQENAQVILSLDSKNPIQDYRRLAVELGEKNCKLPIHLYVDSTRLEDAALEASSLLGGILVDGIGDSLEIANLPIAESTRLAFNILQATRLRISKAEFIACPSCGRTLFDLQETTQRIKSKTAHLKGVKIAIMGCIVNGPGEMADADFGYVGGGPGKIQLYVGKDCVEKNIPSAIADEKLIELIKKHDRWVEPSLA